MAVCAADPTSAAEAAQGIVRGDIQGIAFTQDGLYSLLHIIAAGDSLLHIAHIHLLQDSLDLLDLEHRVVLAAGVEQAHGLHIGQKLPDQLHLLPDGVHIVGTGDIGARRLIGLDQAGIHRVGHRSNQHGNLTGLGGDALGSASADCQYQVTVIAYNRWLMVSSAEESP